jgi:hypothetical protein
VEEIFLACGYIRKEQNMASIILGNYENGLLQYKGRVMGSA